MVLVREDGGATEGTSDGEAVVYMNRVRGWLITALLVFVALNILLAVLRPLLPFLLVGLALVVIGGMLLGRHD
jgi:hypothetical protein